MSAERLCQIFSPTPTVQAGAAILVLGVMIAAAFYLLSSFRDYAAEDKEPVDGALQTCKKCTAKVTSATRNSEL